jgi:altronate dehydratase large subunit
MAGLATHPNVAACLIVSFEPESGMQIIQRSISARDRRTLSFLDIGSMEQALAQGSKFSAYEATASEHQAVPLQVSELVFSLECGGSDTTSGLFGPGLGAFTDRLIDLGGTAVFSEPVECLGAEALLRQRAVSSEVAARLIKTVHAYNRLAMEHGVDLAGTNPTPDNMAGGLTSIEEKSLGALAKTGTQEDNGVVGYGEAPKVPGLWMMDAPARQWKTSRRWRRAARHSSASYRIR